ncbi:MAG: F0F1 ATP synthase subunit epsilon [Planctomycetota bacterium]
MAEADPLKLLVITPERQVLDEAARSVVIPAHDGELGILLDRAPLMCELGVGELRYSRGGEALRLFIDGGFAQVLDNRIVVLTTRAIPADKLTADMVGQAEREAERITANDDTSRAARQRARERASVLRRMLANR